MKVRLLDLLFLTPHYSECLRDSKDKFLLCNMSSPQSEIDILLGADVYPYVHRYRLIYHVWRHTRSDLTIIGLLGYWVIFILR